MTNTKDNWDKKEKTLTVPPHISKTGDYHVIPLSDSATQILKVMEERYPKSGFLFPADTAEGHLLSAESGSRSENFVNGSHLINSRRGTFDAHLKRSPARWA
jgi:hypothetical protein